MSELKFVKQMDHSRLKQLQEEYNRLDDQYSHLQAEHREQQAVRYCAIEKTNVTDTISI